MLSPADAEIVARDSRLPGLAAVVARPRESWAAQRERFQQRLHRDGVPGYIDAEQGQRGRGEREGGDMRRATKSYDDARS